MANQDRSDLGTEKRLLIALLLSTLVLLGAPYLIQKFYPSEPPAEVPIRETPQIPPAVVEAERVTQPLQPEASVSERELTRGTARRVVVRNGELALVWSSEGAVLESARLRRYFGDEKEPLEILSQDLPRSLPRTLALWTGNESIDKELSDAVYEIEGAPEDQMTAPVVLQFHYRGPRVEVFRQVSIPEQGYLFELESEVRVDGRPSTFFEILGPGIGAAGVTERGDFGQQKLAVYDQGAVERWDAGHVDEPVTLSSSLRWVGLDSQYFSYLVLDSGSFQEVRLGKELWARKSPSGDEVALSLLTAKVGLAGRTPHSVFIGPKDLEILQAADPTLTGLVDYGWFGILVRPLLSVLKLIYSVVHNYGWAIIILTLLINLALVPIRYKQIVSMKKMSVLQPQMKAIQERYKKFKKDDPRRQDMNKEVMALYQEHGVNPLGGCLPLLVQMPFLFAFYRMLASSIELRGAPFMFWIHDLSKPDAYWITPIAMGITMVAQQRMTPATGDAAQRRMMMLLPVVFTFFFLNVSSGLAIYFLFSNIFGMLFQLGMQKLRPEMAKSPSPAVGAPDSKKRKSK